jgi:ABC-2 type transport system permease protein
MKILKLSNAEMRKIYSRIGIFVMAFLFIFILASSTFIYNAPERNSGIVNISGDTVTEVYNNYNTSTNYESQESYDQVVIDTQAMINAYSTPTTGIADLQIIFDDALLIYNNYSTSVNTGGTPSTSYGYKNNLRAEFENYRDTYNNLFESQYTELLVNERTHIAMLQHIENVLDSLPALDEVDNIEILNDFNELDPFNVINDYVGFMSEFSVDPSLIIVLNSSYAGVTNLRLAELTIQIDNFVAINGASEEFPDTDAINLLISNYKLTAYQFNKIATNAIILNAFDGLTNEEINDYVGFSNVHLYEVQEEYSRNVFLFYNVIDDGDELTVEIGDFAYNYSNPFKIGTASHNEANALDFAYFTLELFSFMIIIYVVVLGAGMIAGEEANGTLKLVAMRPYKRYKIFLAKILSTLRVAFMLLLIGSVASIITGSYIYGGLSNLLPTLAVINANTIVAISPYAMFGIYLATLFIEIIFYVILAVSISSIFKSYTGAVTVSTLIYFSSMILLFISNAVWLKYIPLTNTDLFRYFGSNFIVSFQSGGLDSLLSPPLLIDTSLPFSAIVLGSSMMVLLIVALAIFSKRDLK